MEIIDTLIEQRETEVPVAKFRFTESRRPALGKSVLASPLATGSAVE